MAGSNTSNQACCVSEVLAPLPSEQKDVSASSKQPSSESFYVPMGQMAFILGALQKMLQFSVDQTQILAQNQQASNLAYMGGTEDKNGVVTIDYEKGIIYCLQKAQVDAGKDESDGLKEQSKAHWGAMGSNGGGLLIMGGNMCKNFYQSRQGPEAELKRLTEIKTQLNGAAPPQGTQVGGSNTPVAADRVQDQIAEWKKGNFEKVGDETVKDAAFKQLKNTTDATTKADRKAVEEKLDEQIKEQKSAIERIGSGEQSFNMFINQAVNGASSGAQAYYTAKQATASEAKGKDNAAASVLQTIQSQWSSSLDRTREQSDSARQEAIQIANSIAQIQNTRV